MPRRKKTRSTKKKKVDKKHERQTPGGLSERQFAALPIEYHSFFVEDSDHEQSEFTKDDTVYIKHENSEDSGETINDNHWIGVVRQIRGVNPDNVWIKVQWFWAPEEVAEVIKSFDPSICGKYEKFQSNNFDIVTAHCVVGHVEVKHFDETSIYQTFIGDEEWFTRYEFLYEARRITPKVTRGACPICKIPYTPGAEKVLHFCPHLSCQKFYHQSCLVKHGYVEKTHKHCILETWPDVDRTVSVEEICDLHHPRKRQKRDHPPSKESSSGSLAGFPAELVAVAKQPIVRGTQAGGIVGNIASVAAARKMIYKALKGDNTVPDDWETRIDMSTAFVDSNSFPNCICPNCHSPI